MISGLALPRARFTKVSFRGRFVHFDLAASHPNFQITELRQNRKIILIADSLAGFFAVRKPGAYNGDAVTICMEAPEYQWLKTACPRSPSIR
jgi:hypothetical protein